MVPLDQCPFKHLLSALFRGRKLKNEILPLPMADLQKQQGGCHCQVWKTRGACSGCQSCPTNPQAAAASQPCLGSGGASPGPSCEVQNRPAPQAERWYLAARRSYQPRLSDGGRHSTTVFSGSLKANPKTCICTLNGGP